jgi:hypothetical protein
MDKTCTKNGIYAKQIKALVVMIALFALSVGTGNAQVKGNDKYGNTLNIGLGFTYLDYFGSAPMIMLNYEFDVARNFTVAPFIGYASHRSDKYYNYHGGPDYYYRNTLIPVGAKATYYFDQLLGANPKWDFYLAASLGFAYNNQTWTDGYYGDKSGVHSVSPLYADLHIGSEYHFNKKVGIFLDVSTGISTFGLAIHQL